MDQGSEQKLYWDDATWILTSSFIIFTMQSGFALLESGCVTRKNEVNIMVKNAVDVVFGGLGYWMYGYGLSFGRDKGSNALISLGQFFIDANEGEIGSVFSTYFFQLSFSTTATTIVSGAMAERTNLLAYCIFSFLNTAIYCLPAGWIWGEIGFLRRLGVVDLAGCVPVHLVGGASALVAAAMLKPRLGRYDNGQDPPPMGNPSNALVGMFMLWWGWLGFNCGSIFGVSGDKWKYAARSAIATLNSSVGGGVLAMAYSFLLYRKVRVLILINGILASLVAITAGCALYEPWEALVVGAVGAFLAIVAMPLFDKIHIDDPVGCIAVHGVGALWGMVAVGLFVKEDTLLSLSRGQKGLFRGGGLALLGVQCVACVAVAVWSCLSTGVLLFCINRVIPIRTSAENETLGADVVEHKIRQSSNDGGLPLIQWAELEDPQSPVISIRNAAKIDMNIPSAISGRGIRRQDDINEERQIAWVESAVSPPVKRMNSVQESRSRRPWRHLPKGLKEAMKNFFRDR